MRWGGRKVEEGRIREDVGTVKSRLEFVNDFRNSSLIGKVQAKESERSECSAVGLGRAQKHGKESKVEGRTSTC